MNFQSRGAGMMLKICLLMLLCFFVELGEAAGRPPPGTLWLNERRGCLRMKGGSDGGSCGAVADGTKAHGDWDRRILVTGGCGFAGSVLADHLSKKYPRYLIVVFDRMDECASLRNIDDALLRPNCIFVKGDIADAPFMDKVLTDHSIESVMHLAGQTSVDYSFTDPEQFTRDNVVGTVSLLESCRRAAPNLTRFLYCSTDEVYGGVPTGFCGEDAPLAPANPYSASKAAAEQMVMAYCRSFGMPVIVSRTCNMYGRNQYPEKVIPRFILLAKRRLACSIHGNGDAIRSFIFVDDAVEAFDLILHEGKVGEVYNVGTKQLVTVRELADKIVDKVLEGEVAKHRFIKDRVLNDCRYAVDCSKLEALGWTASTSFENGLKATIDWYQDLDEGHWDRGACERAVLQAATE